MIDRKDDKLGMALMYLSADVQTEANEARRKKSAKEIDQALAEILTPEQMKRYIQVELQALGSAAFSDPDVQKTLKLTEGQKATIKRLADDDRKAWQDDYQPAMAKAKSFRMVGFWRDMQAAMAKSRARHAVLMHKIVSELLDDEQQKVWKDMTGAPFSG